MFYAQLEDESWLILRTPSLVEAAALTQAYTKGMVHCLGNKNPTRVLTLGRDAPKGNVVPIMLP